jgi:hypothetical protein
VAGHHRRLKERLAGSDEWQEFEGTSNAWPLLGGLVAAIVTSRMRIVRL